MYNLLPGAIQLEFDGEEGVVALCGIPGGCEGVMGGGQVQI